MPYTLIQKFNTQHSHIKFNGTFQGKTVTWNTHFFTLEGYNAKVNIEDTNMKQFIDINHLEESNMELTVVLNIAEVSPPNIQKMIIMIRQYKNLSLGRHEYG